MDTLKTIVGHHLSNLFLDNVTFDIATFLQLSEADIVRRAAAKMKLSYERLTHQKVKGKMTSFERYTPNLKYGPFGVYSYGTEVIELNWEPKKAKRLGRWSQTTSRHMNSAIQNLIYTWGFKEIN